MMLFSKLFLFRFILLSGSSFLISWKQYKYPLVDEWINMPWYIYAMEFYATVKMKEILPFVTAWVDLGNILLS